MHNNRYSRKRLYHLVWAKPLSKISIELDLPDSQIRKICKDFHIPLPKAGYWKKLEYGKLVEKPVLPEYEGEDLIDLNLAREGYKSSYPFRLLKRTKEIQEEHPKLSNVSDRLTKPHPLVVRARYNLSKKRAYKTDGYEESVNTSYGYIAIDVSKSNVARMLRFVDALIKLSEVRGHEIMVDHRQTKIKIDEELIPISFREKCNRKSVNTYSWPSTILVPNGKLSVKIAKPYSSTEWVEGTDSIEEQLPKIVAALELYAEKEKKEREEIHRYWEEHRRIQKIKDEEMARKKFEEEKVQILLRHSEEWRKANNLKAFIDRVEHNYKDSESHVKIQHWVKWARIEVKKIDPIFCEADSFLDQYDYESSKSLKRDLSPGHI